MIVNTVEQYISSPFEVSLDLALSATVLKRFEKLLTVRSRFYFTKISQIKKLVKTLIQEDVFQPFSFKTLKTFQKKAYMRDGDGLYISYGIFFKTRETVFLSVLCHELAHIWLSQREFYPQLKILNKEYLDRFEKRQESALTSPIEVYARIVSLHIINQLALSIQHKKRKKKALSVIEIDNEKIEKLKKTFENIEPKTDL